MAQGPHGSGLWSCAMTESRLHGINDWLAKAPPGHGPPAYCQPLSRHWQGADLTHPHKVGSHGRRETDVREICAKRTVHAPDAGLRPLRNVSLLTPWNCCYPVFFPVTDLQHICPMSISLLSGIVQRGLSRYIHGDDDMTHLPADAVIYEHSPPREHHPQSMLEPLEREGGPSFYLGEVPSKQPKHGVLEPGRSEWRHGDTRTFTLDGTEYAPPTAMAINTGTTHRPSILDSEASRMAALACGEAGPDPRVALQGSYGRRESDLHEGEHATRGSPSPTVVPKTFHRSSSDITLHSGGAAARERRKRTVGRRLDGLLPHQLAEVDEVCALQASHRNLPFVHSLKYALTLFR